MKERIVIEKTKECRPHPALRDGVNCIDTKYCKYEKVPEDFADLQELCKDLKGCKVEEGYIEVFGCLVGSNILFCKDGAIMLNTDCCFAEKVSVERMWQIIKSLTGEE